VAAYGQQLIVFHRLVGQLWIAVNRCEHQFGWRRSADRACLRTISLLSGNLTGNFANLRHLKAALHQEIAVLQRLFVRFPN